MPPTKPNLTFHPWSRLPTKFKLKNLSAYAEDFIIGAPCSCFVMSLSRTNDRELEALARIVFRERLLVIPDEAFAITLEEIIRDLKRQVNAM